tara:strand:- start:236 stop:358 length:123 start_codon:yes stop_codon:yes gene_type:complete
MFLGLFILFVIPLILCLGILILNDYIIKIQKWKKNQTKNE